MQSIAAEITPEPPLTVITLVGYPVLVLKDNAQFPSAK